MVPKCAMQRWCFGGPNQQHSLLNSLKCSRHPSRCSGTREIQVRAGESILPSVLKSLTTIGRDPDLSLSDGIANFYDESSELWEGMWGEHMHHGLYPKGNPPKSHQQAQVSTSAASLVSQWHQPGGRKVIGYHVFTAGKNRAAVEKAVERRAHGRTPCEIDMIEKVLEWAGVDSCQRMVDVGCGIGGSSRHIARNLGCEARGISLSPVQIQRATQLTAEQGLEASVKFQVADALRQPFQDGEFDLVWSLESGEHMPDKAVYVGELARVCAPGGRVIIVTWCHRNLEAGETDLRAEEQQLLDRLCEAYYLPAWCSVNDYNALMEREGLTDVRTADWSELVAPFWSAVIQTALSPKGIKGLLGAGWGTMKGALVMPLMSAGFSMGTIKFNLITARKPAP